MCINLNIAKWKERRNMFIITLVIFFYGDYDDFSGNNIPRSIVCIYHQPIAVRF